MTNIAQTILAQLGGNQFRAMTGAALLAGERSLTVKPALGKASAVVVTLDASDTYTVQVYRGRGLKMREIKAVSGVYCDTLREVFEAETGLRCTL